jgi:hypothetical protein
MVNEKNQFFFVIMKPGKPYFTLGKHPFIISSTAPKRGEKGITWGFSLSFLTFDSFPSLFGLFWRAPYHCSRYVFGVEWAGLCLGLNLMAQCHYFLFSATVDYWAYVVQEKKKIYIYIYIYIYICM